MSKGTACRGTSLRVLCAEFRVGQRFRYMTDIPPVFSRLSPDLGLCCHMESCSILKGAVQMTFLTGHRTCITYRRVVIAESSHHTQANL